MRDSIGMKMSAASEAGLETPLKRMHKVRREKKDKAIENDCSILIDSRRKSNYRNHWVSPIQRVNRKSRVIFAVLVKRSQVSREKLKRRRRLLSQ
ncbi:hypothetical protein ElyMa_001544300 [Elysia marginata]|uniref:Uncharacterized protein n=1 Tax=Elysia marginata TaxID=1093978 RepID=A0AAV4JC61_9GAST|nr:hypothetical protein ElyMa_001544300 [Elysia marginata]